MKTSLRSAPMLFAFAALAALSAGCAPEFDHLEFSNRTSPPVGVTVAYDSIRVTEGIAVGVDAIPFAGSHEMDEETTVELRSDDTSVLGVDPALDRWSFVVYGVNHGSTKVTVVIDGAVSGSIPAIVEPQ